LNQAYLTDEVSVLEVVSPLSEDVSPMVADVSGALCIGAVALVSVVASSEVELSVHEAMIDVIAMIAKNFFILNIFLG